MQREPVPAMVRSSLPAGLEVAVLVGELVEELLREAVRAAQELLEEPRALAPPELGRPLREK